MKATKIYMLAGAMAAGVLSAGAQTASSRAAYFLDGYNYTHEINPAMVPERGYFAIPVLGNINLGVQSNIGVNTFLYRRDGQLTTFMNNRVSASEFLGNLSGTNKIGLDVDLKLISLGFKGFGGYNTLGISLKSQNGLSLPKGFFEFMKVGAQGPDTEYDFGNLRLRTSNYAEIALGHQRQITPELAAGVKVKVLLGLAHVDAHVEKMTVRLSQDKWMIDAQGSMTIGAGSGLKVPTYDETGKSYDVTDFVKDHPQIKPGDRIDFDEISYDNFGLAGFGLGFDLGATYDMHNLVDGLRLSAAITDLGFIRWKNAVKASMPGVAWEFNGFQNVAIDDNQDGYEDNKLESQIENLGDDIEDCLMFQREKLKDSETLPLHATLTIGAEYDMPFYKKLSAGFLFTQRMAGCLSWTEGRFSANVKPVKWFDASISYAASTYGNSFGWMINFHPKGFNFFIGSDHQFFKVTPQFVPVGHLNANINLGINITFGSNYKPKPMVKG